MPDLRLSPSAALLVALLAGTVSAFGFEPWNLIPLALVAVAVLTGLVEHAGSARRAALIGWLFGTGHFAMGLTWIAKAFTFQAKMPAALGWVAVIGLSMFLALYVALATGLARWLAKDVMGRVLVLAATWMLGEWLRGWVLSGFAWNPLGAVWVTVPGIRQLAQYGGALALSGLTVVVAGGLWLVVRSGAWIGERVAGAALAVVVTIAALAGQGDTRDAYYPDSPVIYLVQPDIGQDVKYVAASEEAHLQAYLDMTANALAAARHQSTIVAMADTELPAADGFDTIAPDAAPGDPLVTPPDVAAVAAGVAEDRTAEKGSIVVWSEGSVPYAVEEEPRLRARLASVLGPNDLLMFGAPAVIRDGRGEVTALTNSLFVLDAKGRLRGRYDKAHLVPLGEYVPARPLMEQLGLARLTPGDIDFRPGPGPRTLALPAGFSAVGVMICYEIIFPGAVVEPGKRPAWIVTISNDAWFGPTGPPQHLAQARLRAIEEGLPIVRVTPTGISAIIDGHGRLSAVQGIGAKGVSASRLPPPLPATPFARFGHVASLVIGFLLMIIGLTVDRSRRAPSGALRGSQLPVA